MAVQTHDETLAEGLAQLPAELSEQLVPWIEALMHLVGDAVKRSAQPHRATLVMVALTSLIEALDWPGSMVAAAEALQ